MKSDTFLLGSLVAFAVLVGVGFAGWTWYVSALKHVETQTQTVTIYFKKEADGLAQMPIVTAVDQHTSVKSTFYQSRENTLAQFREQHKDDVLTLKALEELGENPFGGSLEVVLLAGQNREDFVTFVKNVDSNTIIESINLRSY
jgi:cell division protein FtsX